MVKAKNNTVSIQDIMINLTQDQSNKKEAQNIHYSMSVVRAEEASQTI